LDGDDVTILHTTDGSTWTLQATGLILDGASLSSVVTVDSMTAWAAGGLSNGYGVVIRTTDGGENWTRVGSAPDLPSCTNCLYAFDSNTAWVVGIDNMIRRTADGGETWESCSDPAFDGTAWQGIHCLSQTDIWVSGGMEGQGGRIIHTVNGGLDWTSEADSLIVDYQMITVTAWDASNVWVVGHGFSIIKTTDGGDSWNMVTPDSFQGYPDDANGITLLSPNDAWVVLDYGNIWKTSDGGENWTYQSVPSGVGGFLMLRISAQDLNTAWASGRSGSGLPEGAVIYTNDGGSTWTRQDDGSYPGLWAVSFADDCPN
jgi:photosystem II stability/assembly factor-like uncharacterized protein